MLNDFLLFFKHLYFYFNDLNAGESETIPQTNATKAADNHENAATSAKCRPPETTSKLTTMETPALPTDTPNVDCVTGIE